MDTDTANPQLPDPIAAFLAAHRARDVAAAVAVLTPDATVVDEGRTYRARDGIAEFLQKAGSAYTYTTTVLGTERVDDGHWVVVHRLEGDFPGGVVDLRYRFTLEAGLVSELVIAP